MTRTQGERSRRWRATPRGKYAEAKRKAKRRGVGFLLTFEQWFGIWQASGKFEQRATNGSGYVMRRYGDLGPYAVGNVYIGTHTENAIEGWRNGLCKAAMLRDAREHERLYCPVDD